MKCSLDIISLLIRLVAVFIRIYVRAMFIFFFSRLWSSFYLRSLYVLRSLHSLDSFDIYYHYHYLLNLDFSAYNNYLTTSWDHSTLKSICRLLVIYNLAFAYLYWFFFFLINIIYISAWKNLCLSVFSNISPVTTSNHKEKHVF